MILVFGVPGHHEQEIEYLLQEGLDAVATDSTHTKRVGPVRVVGVVLCCQPRIVDLPGAFPVRDGLKDLGRVGGSRRYLGTCDSGSAQ